MEAARKTAEALREQASLARELGALARRRAGGLRTLAQARARESAVCNEQSVDALVRYSELAGKEAQTCEHEADTFEAEATRFEREAEAAERRPAGSFMGFAEGEQN